MELCKDVLDGLALINKDKGRISNEEMDQVLQVVAASVATNKNQEHQVSLPNIESKLVVLSLITLFAETSRQNSGLESEVKSIQEVLSDCDVDDTRTGLILTLYREKREELWKRLDSLEIKGSQVGTTVSTVTDLDWRREVIVKTSSRERMTPYLRYILSFKTTEGKDFDLQTDVSGLEQLAFSLREACKAVEKLN